MKSLLLLTLLSLTLAISAHAQFVTIWKTDNPGASASNQIMLNRSNTTAFNLSYIKIDDGSVGSFTPSGFAPIITFPQPGTYRVIISGAGFNNITMGGNPDYQKLLSIEQWGTVGWTSMANAFSTCINLEVNATDAPNLANCTSMRQMFEACTAVTGVGFETWNVSNVQSFLNTFAGATAFNGNISSWNTSSATDMTGMFAATSSFDQDLSSWNVSNVTNMQNMFRASAFNHDINSWNVFNVTIMAGMFSLTQSFNQPLDGWNVSNVTDFSQMFAGALSFNQLIGSWNVSSGNAFAEMFNGALVFNAPIGNWNMSNCVNATAMFQDAQVFNRDISNWNMGNNQSLAYMFAGATQFNQPLGSWDVHSTNTTGNMFADAVSFNQDLSLWNTTNVTYMAEMFRNASSFTQDIHTWNVANVNDMTRMFFGAANFNIDISNWDVRNVVSMTGVFQNASSFNQNLATWNIQSVNDLSDIFHNSGLSNENYDNILIGWADLPSLGSDVTLGAQTNSYCLGEAARNLLVLDYNWFIFDGGLNCGGNVPTIVDFNPKSGPTGTLVTITCANLDEPTGVFFGGVAAASWQQVNATTIIAVVGNGATGDVLVEDNAGDASASVFTFISPTPIISIKNSENNTGSPIQQQIVIDMGSTLKGVQLDKTLTIANTGSVNDTLVSVTLSSQVFSVARKPTVILSQDYDLLTIALNSATVGTYTTHVTLTFQTSTFEFDMTGKVESTDLPKDLIVYNAVTPNGDGAHDFLKIVNIEQYDGNKVVIIDRMGNEVFSVNDYDNSDASKRFEGIANKGGNKNLTDGTYYYIIDLHLKKLTGFLLLQR